MVSELIQALGEAYLSQVLLFVVNISDFRGDSEH